MSTSNASLILAEVGDDPSFSDVRRAWSRLRESLDGLPKMRVAISATYTTDSLQPYLGWQLARAGFALQWSPVPFNQIYQQLLDPSSDLAVGESGVAVVLPRIEELLATAWNELPANPQRARDAASQELDAFISAVGCFTERHSGLLLVGNFLRPPVLPLGILDGSSESGGIAFTDWLNQEWRNRLMPFHNVRILDVVGLLANVGYANATDPTRWFMGRIPFKESTMQAVATQIARCARAWSTPPKKVIALDCDNTLWGGIVGEDGPTGINVGAEAPGNTYSAFQEYLLTLQRRGVLIALCSKNNEQDVWEAFDQNTGMVLARSDVVAWRINWERKSTNLRALAAELNLGSDSFVFIDDSPIECAEVRANAPEVSVIQLPDDPAQFIDAVESSWLFDRLTFTSEDYKRHTTYIAERQRAELRGNMASIDDYLQTLGLRVEIFHPSPQDFPRVAQLIAKTNQFNLTTRRRSEGELRSLTAGEHALIYGVRVRDRFGEYGLTGVAIVADIGRRRCIDTFLLSCRILGRGIEDALLRRLIEDARSEGHEYLYAQYLPTQKNAPAADFLSRWRFGRPDADSWQVLNLRDVELPSLTHIAIETDPVPSESAKR